MIKINKMLTNFYELHGLYKKAIRECKKGLKNNPGDEILKVRIDKLKKESKKMDEKRRFKCISCGHEFEVPFGTGQSGDQMDCPKCGAEVYRLNGSGFQARRGYAGGRGHGGRGRGYGSGRGPRGGGQGRGRCGRFEVDENPHREVETADVEEQKIEKAKGDK